MNQLFYRDITFLHDYGSQTFPQKIKKLSSKLFSELLRY